MALLALGGLLATAFTRPQWLPEAIVAAAGGAVLVAVGAISASDAADTLGDLAPTIGFLAALLLLGRAVRLRG